MHNIDLAKDYIRRANIRLKAVRVLFEEKSWADVVRESQEIVELSLKALLRHSGIHFPRVHDVSAVLLEHQQRLPEMIQSRVKDYARISKKMRRDRELAFYGGEDLTPSEFYSEDDASESFEEARLIVEELKPLIDT